MNNKSRLSIGVFIACWFMFQLVLSGCATGPYYESAPTNPINILPQDNVDIPANTDISFVWQESENAHYYEFHIYNQSSKDTAQYDHKALSPLSVCVEGRCSLTLNVKLPALEGHAWRVRAGNNAGLTDWTRTRFNMVSQSIDASSDAGISTIVELDVDSVELDVNSSEPGADTPELEVNNPGLEVNNVELDNNKVELVVIDEALDLKNSADLPVVADREIVSDAVTQSENVDAIAIDANTAMDMSAISNKVVLIDAAARSDTKVNVVTGAKTLTVIDMSGIESVSENAELNENAELEDVTTPPVASSSTGAPEASTISDIQVTNRIQVSSDIPSDLPNDLPNDISDDVRTGNDFELGKLKPPSLLQPIQGTSIPVGALVDFNWQAVPGAISYEFYVYDSVNKEMIEATVDLPAETLCVIQNICYVTRTVTLPPASSHAWRVRAVTENGLSPYSSGRFGVVH